MMAVTVLEDWTNAVARMPTTSPMNGLVAKVNRDSTPSVPPDT